ncbi:MAG: methylenetetrahydrofolate reductase [NAD(P)H] [Cytophagaceae bacterium]|jgi:methylenetetrahydrofolate reductase (NADPH)|nr:methylenetetrahydrofolate reductase [NAD(P)H] [Cytophagaceae bacterium]
MTTAAQLIRDLKAPAFSFELLPPLKGNSINRVFATIETLKDFNPVYINITSHRDEVVYSDIERGLYERKVIRKRPGTVAVAAAIQHRYGIKVIPHIICSGFTRSETEYALIDLNFLGIHDILLLRGDNSHKERFVQAGGDDVNKYAIDLISQINEFNKGIFLDSTAGEPFETPFSYGVAGYPEKHEEAPNLESDMYRLKKKVEAGAEYVITQMFFDNRAYFNFVERCRCEGITVPIIPGLKPVTFMNQLTVLPKIFHVDIPEPFAKELRKCKTDADTAKVGVEWCTQQAKELLNNNVNLLHFYTLMATQSIKQVAEAIY